MRELQGRWPELHWDKLEVGGRSSVPRQGSYGRLRELRCAGWRENTQQGTPEGLSPRPSLGGFGVRNELSCAEIQFANKSKGFNAEDVESLAHIWDVSVGLSLARL